MKFFKSAAILFIAFVHAYIFGVVWAAVGSRAGSFVLGNTNSFLSSEVASALTTSLLVTAPLALAAGSIGSKPRLAYISLCFVLVWAGLNIWFIPAPLFSREVLFPLSADLVAIACLTCVFSTLGFRTRKRIAGSYQIIRAGRPSRRSIPSLTLISGSGMIPRNEQIDAALDGALWTLKLHYCDGSILTLQSMWTVSLGEIVVVAKERGLGAYVRDQRGGDGIFLLKAPDGYEVCYMERAANTFSERYAELEPAFLRWLSESLKTYGLLRDDGR